MKSFRSLPLLRNGLTVLAFGWTVYGIFRSASYPLLPQIPTPVAALPSIVDGSIATLLHVWGMALITAGIMPRVCFNRKWLAPSLWLAINLVFEFGQLLQTQTFWFGQGRFDWNDIAAAFIGGALALLHLKRAASGSWIQQTRPWQTALVLMLGSLSLSATSRHTPYPLSTPVYMPYEEFRSSFATLTPQPIQRPGKIYVMGSYLLVNDINQGVHIIDNSDPKQPKPLKFLKVLGNRDIAMRNHVLYVDSYVDMLVISLADLEDPKLLQRITDVFPYDPYAWFGKGVGNFDESQGIVIDVIPNSKSKE